jgi:hypothetical protein
MQFFKIRDRRGVIWKTYEYGSTLIVVDIRIEIVNANSIDLGIREHERWYR